MKNNKMNHKAAMLIAGVIVLMGAIAAPAMPVSAKTTETAETAITEEAGMPAYKYTGTLPYMSAVCDEIIAENEKFYDKADVAIPEPYIVRVDDSDQNDVKVWGRFGYFTYNVDGAYLQTQAGGLPVGVMHLAKDENGEWTVTSVQLAEDGAGCNTSLMKICENDRTLYDAFNIDEKSGNDNRAAFIREYLASNGMDFKGYQDYGWDPVDITIDQEVYTGGYDFGK